MSSNVVPMKLFKNYSVTFNRSTDYTFRVLATNESDAKHQVLTILDSQCIETFNEHLTGKSVTYTNILEIKER